jgi:hypothetical protein
LRLLRITLARIPTAVPHNTRLDSGIVELFKRVEVVQKIVAELQLRFNEDFVHKTPHPVLAGLDGLHHRMFGGVKMFGSVFVLGRIAAAHVAALAA